jgi:hypothetical protein
MKFTRNTTPRSSADCLVNTEKLIEIFTTVQLILIYLHLSFRINLNCHMKAYAILLVLGIICHGAIAQVNEDAAGSLLLSPTSMINYTSLATSTCSGTTYNLGNSTSTQMPAAISGIMGNDVWFHFVAVAEVAKIKVCTPSGFDASIELWNANATGTPISASNANGIGQKEVICANSLVVGNTYKVRVGRSNTNGPGTFILMYEHMAIEVRSGFFPNPPGAATCYDFATPFQRTPVTPSVGSTKWKFVDTNGNVYGPYTGTYLFNFGLATGLCENVTSVVAYAEIQANDADCGNIYWGYSTGRTLDLCTYICPTISAAANTVTCGGTVCDILYTTFSCSNVGDGFQYQFKFVTDNGQSEFITSWSTSPIFQTQSVSYLRYGKIYQVYARVKRCNNNAQWCGPCTFSTCAFPYASILGTNNYCKWRSPSGIIEATPIAGMDRYRYRLTPVNTCAANPFLPTGGAMLTGWTSNSFFNIGAYNLPQNQVYMLQVQCRVNSGTYTNSSGQTITIPAQQSDWGWPCFIGLANASSPAAGSSIQCCSYGPPSSITLPEELIAVNRSLDMYDLDSDTYEEETFVAEGRVKTITIQDNAITLDVSESLLSGYTQVEIYSINGQLIHTSSLAAIHENSTVTITTERELSNGIYLITLSNAQGRVTEKLLVAN